MKKDVTLVILAAGMGSRYGGLKQIEPIDKYGNFIEQLKSIKEVKEKYHIPTSKIRNIQQGDRYFGDYIFKYSK